MEQKEEKKEEETQIQQLKVKFLFFKTQQFKIPVKILKTKEDALQFKQSKIYQKILDFIKKCQESIKSKKRSETQNNKKFDKIIAFLSEIIKLIDEIPPTKQPTRFGNKAYLTWHNKVREMMPDVLEDFLPENLKKSNFKENECTPSEELMVYLIDSFGSYERLDYGTGHELNFLMFLMCIEELKLSDENDYAVMIHYVFYEYMKLMRKIQKIYFLEPAGSHGVWGLDDFHFLPFLFGASELINSKEFKTPDIIHLDKLIAEFSEEYFYISCIHWIKIEKAAAPFHLSSPMLYDISGAASWDKVAAGFMKMYQDEVLLKFPIVQHTYFGSLLPYE